MILAILVGNHVGNIPVKFKSHWPKGSRRSELLKQIVYDVRRTTDDEH